MVETTTEGKHVHVHVYTYVHVHVHVYTHIHVHVYICTCVFYKPHPLILKGETLFTKHHVPLTHSYTFNIYHGRNTNTQVHVCTCTVLTLLSYIL